MPKLKVLTKTPAQLGYTFPAEWAKQEATWFSWPRPEGISFPGKYHTIPQNIAAIMRQITPRQWVYVNVPNDNWEYIVRAQLKECGVDLKRVKFFHIKTNENWCRDHGPAFVVNKKGQRAIVDWGFNAWGGKYAPYDADDDVPSEIAFQLGLPVFYPRKTPFITKTPGQLVAKIERPLVIMEGGAVEFNGAGTVLTTTDCLLNKNRNPDLSQAQVEQYLKDYYGQTNVCWLTGGIEGDDTDGHVDDLARFISPTKLVMSIESDPKDANYKVLKRARKQADNLRDQAGRPFEIIELPMPGPVEHDSERLPATYINFLFINRACLVPTFGPKSRDKKAIDILQSHLPKHEVIGIDCHELIWGLGAIHCLTQQMPAGK
ncbi:MAG: agmatine deiminase family protein [Burkholderiales bacterium]|nr:agmatine deiminase family protein [Phycisphaerae bacterium]